jgi:hypothetical protein
MGIFLDGDVRKEGWNKPRHTRKDERNVKSFFFLVDSSSPEMMRSRKEEETAAEQQQSLKCKQNLQRPQSALRGGSEQVFVLSTGFRAVKFSTIRG